MSANNLTTIGIAAMRAGNRQEAQRLFEMAIRQNDQDLSAWWWLAQVQEDPSARHKCLDHARGIATQSEQSLAIWRSLLQQAGTPVVRLYQLNSRSGSLGANCPICTEKLAANSQIVLCPKCKCAHHHDCWEMGAAYHCGSFACDGTALIDRASPVQVEPPSSASEIIVPDELIPAEPVWESREKQEARFTDRLRERMMQTFVADMTRAAIEQRIRQERAERARRAEMERQARIATGTMLAVFLGLIVGIVLVLAVVHASSWPMSIFIVYLSASCFGTVVFQWLQAQDRLTSALYGILPQVITAAILFFTWGQKGNNWVAELPVGWGNALSFISSVPGDWTAILLAWVGGLWLGTRVLRAPFLYERRAFITYGILAMVALFFWRRIAQ